MEKIKYHLNCTECGNDYWTDYAFDQLCPRCHEYFINKAWELNQD